MGDPPEVGTATLSRIDTGALHENVQRYLINHLLDEIRHNRWIRQTRSAGLLASGHNGARVTGAPLSDGFQTQRYTELVLRLARCIVLPDPDLGMDRLDVYGIVLIDEAFAQMQRDLALEDGHLDLHFGNVLNLLETGKVRRVWNIKRAQPENRIPHATYYRNPRITEFGALACERLLQYCDVVRAPRVVAERYLEHLDEMTAQLIQPDQVAQLLAG